MRASRMEICVEEILQANDIVFKEEYSIEGLNSSNGRPLRFDFAVFNDDGNIDFFIECQGRQHYEPVGKYGGKKGFYQQQFNDNKKRRYCAMHGIPLVEIPYTDEGTITYDYIMEKAGY